MERNWEIERKEYYQMGFEEGMNIAKISESEKGIDNIDLIIRGFREGWKQGISTGTLKAIDKTITTIKGVIEFCKDNNEPEPELSELLEVFLHYQKEIENAEKL